MPRSLPTMSGSTISALSAGLRPAVVWGGMAGSVIGLGISLDIGLFYTSSAYAICIVIFASAFLGALFGHGMAQLLADEDVSFAGLMADNNRHFLETQAGHDAILTDHMELKSDILQSRASGDVQA